MITKFLTDIADVYAAEGLNVKNEYAISTAGISILHPKKKCEWCGQKINEEDNCSHCGAPTP